MLQTSVKGIANLEKALEAYGDKNRKAMRDAIKGAAYRLTDRMRREMSAGHAGGRRFADLSMIGRYTQYGGKNTPLKGMAPAARYWVKDENPITVSIGFTWPKLSRAWRHYGKVHQEDHERVVTEPVRKELIRIGARLGKRSKYRKYFFLKKSTTVLKYPARPIIDPFWAAHETEAMDLVRDLYRLKMAGKSWPSIKLYRSGEHFGRISGHGR